MGDQTGKWDADVDVTVAGFGAAGAGIPLGESAGEAAARGDAHPAFDSKACEETVSALRGGAAFSRLFSMLLMFIIGRKEAPGLYAAQRPAISFEE